MCGHALGEHLAALHVLGHRRQHVAEARAVDRIAHVAQAVDDGNARPYHLLQVEAEVDEILARDLAARPDARAAAVHLLVGDEVEPHAAQPQLEVHLVDRVHPAARRPAGLVYRFVFVGGHGRSMMSDE
ncbi:hypothetical protein D3C83_45360 [compost metagenome]